MSANLGNLEKFWGRLLSPFCDDFDLLEEAFQRTVHEYNSSGRYHHTLEHIVHVLDIIETFQTEVNDLTNLRIAAWFHDVVYDPKSDTNEEDSAEFAQFILSPMEFHPLQLMRVHDLILLTKEHEVDPDDKEGAILLDADLSILGASEEIYLAYSHNIRKEYGFVPGEFYSAARRRVLETFLDKDRIYITDKLHESLEKTARRNIRKEINYLQI
jgi:predicted metal-dependent HD superfamily phosphohydrolase